ncbi:type II toxin-antitoxin system Phd/YefM family antitoxin [Finegoldia magna]|uniref:type II toxin-antitoxin system Phd/YefM family antitoxin n=1 Tax=Finegoldia magna TaxID=1260 RepID=UPI000D71B2F6|nr:type II toxin-antitoxin system Phd/YefM family antitoxin [Finegoldia magna]MCC3310121.1 type II toxin-antitoxin system Phd/YefM family antitoxin [Finegoldia magna]PWV44829.1 antitoxin Phd_YefM of type II toxin-antitoxin system [Finegoldia magna]
MKITTAKNFRDNLSEMIDELIKSNEHLKVTTETGNVIVLSGSDYNGIMETLRIYSNPQEKEKIIEGLHTTIDDCVLEDEINRNNL